LEDKKKHQQKNNDNPKEDDEIVFVKFVTENRVAILRENFKVSFFGWSDSPFWINNKLTPFKLTPEEEETTVFDQREFPGSGPFLVNKIKAVFLNKGKILIVGGYFDGCLKVFHVDYEEELPQKYYYHNETITVMESDEKERFLMTGSKSGECICWHIGSNYYLTKKFAFYDHEGEVLSVHISSEMKVIMTGGIDQKIFVYNYMTGQILKSIMHPDQEPIHNLIIASSPLPVIVFFSEVDQMLYSYSVNGQLLEKAKEEATSLKNFTICKNIYCLDFLVKLVFMLIFDILYEDLYHE
jgi:WD40 repeat protein